MSSWQEGDRMLVAGIESGFRLVQPGEGDILGQHYLPSPPTGVLWGWLPNGQHPPVLTVGDGETVTIDTISAEGVLEDQGRDPVSFFAQHGVHEVLRDAVEIAASDIERPPDAGPHVVTGPVEVVGARPGDVLAVEVLDLTFRAPYGLISSRDGRSALPGEYAEEFATVANEVGTVSYFAWVAALTEGRMDAGGGREISFPLAPFLGIMATAPDTAELVCSIPPGPYGGNMDIKHAGVGATVYLPVAVPGAMFSAGDPHFAQGNGEVALTAFEAPLRATVRLNVIPDNRVASLRPPMVETAKHWILTGMDPSLDEAMRKTVRAALDFLHHRFGIARPQAMAYLSAATDFEVSQVVDRVKGIHCMIAKADWMAWH